MLLNSLGQNEEVCCSLWIARMLSMKIILSIFLGFGISAAVHALCPAGLSSITYGYGNSACADDAGRIRQIQGSLEQCPAGFMRSQDEYGNKVCSDNNIEAYDLSAGCPSPFIEHWDKCGQTVCEDMDGKIITELSQ